MHHGTDAAKKALLTSTGEHLFPVPPSGSLDHTFPPNLPQVFIRVAKIAHAGDDEASQAPVKEAGPRQPNPPAGASFDIEGPASSPGPNPDMKKAPVFWLQLRALLIKRALCLKRDTKTWLLNFFFPVLLVLTGLLISKYAITRSVLHADHQRDQHPQMAPRALEMLTGRYPSPAGM
jgi:hypothetical protein